MQTRLQKKQKIQDRYYLNIEKYKYWIHGKNSYNNNYWSKKIKFYNANYFINDRCNGVIFKNFNTYIGNYTTSQTRAMTAYKRKKYITKRLRRKYELSKELKRTRSMTKYLKRLERKYHM